ncbi:MAG: bifunctional [glutamine synthetase] adenylyltransferase/[glutamine synthetase]-adenylyl-L-tyrosine, partial [Propionibacteriaceae bacterium]|nr:bifunctional [glutamine synthetase] adenylyltransferase/[glutamine synthetase]-adenylyl-L-tyrosine [Propionibacteriaceae bacterium]
MIRIATPQGTLARRGFVDASAAERIITDWDAELEVLLDHAAHAADPDLALAGLSRLSEVRPDLLNSLASAPRWARQVIMVLGASASLGQHLIAHPEQVDVLNAELSRTPRERLSAELLTAVGAKQDEMPVATDLSGDGLRLAYRKALLRIAARDLTAAEPIEALDDVAGELSDLADATLGAALAIGRAKVGDDSLHCRLAVVGLGKCGAQELNYVSDVDVLFVAEPRLDERGEPLITSDRAITVATRLAAETTRICSAHTAAGTIWEVDAALRPEGKAGQLVRTLSSHRIYYEKWAKTWEFQAMLKARPSAGDRELGQDFVEMISPMVWRVAERENFVADTQAMRKRVVAHIP